MPPSITSEKITLAYPIFGAAFIDGNHLLVGGGGGEGRSGVGNKLTLLNVSDLPTAKQPATEICIKVLSELELSKQEDAVMSLAIVPTPRIPPSLKSHLLDISEGEEELSVIPCEEHASPTKDIGKKSWLALAGINSSESSQKSGKNDHFRVFNVQPSDSTAISLLSRSQFFSPTTNDESYQRLLRAKGSSVAIASAGGVAGSEIVVIAVSDLNLKRRIRLSGADEAADLDLSNEGLLVYCTTKDIFVTSISEKDDREPRKLVWQSTPPTKGNLRSVRFCSSQRHLIAVLNHPQRTGSELLLIDISDSGKILARKKLHRNIGAVTGMDVVSLGPHQEIIAIAGADQSVEILVVENGKFAAIKTFRDVHPFQITRVAFSPAPGPSLVPGKVSDSIRLATTSMGNTVVVFTIPLISGNAGRWKILRGILVAKQTVLSVLLSLIGVVIFAVALQLMFEARAGLPLPMERNAIISKFNEVLGAKTARAAVSKEPFMILKKAENGDGVEITQSIVTIGEVVAETII